MSSKLVILARIEINLADNIKSIENHAINDIIGNIEEHVNEEITCYIDSADDNCINDNIIDLDADCTQFALLEADSCNITLEYSAVVDKYLARIGNRSELLQYHYDMVMLGDDEEIDSFKLEFCNADGELCECCHDNLYNSIKHLYTEIAGVYYQSV